MSTSGTDTDAARPSGRAATGPRLVVVFRVTTRCNLECGFCAYDRRLPFARQDASRELVLTFAQRLARHAHATGTPIHLSFLGGEPTLWRPLASLEPRLTELGLSLGLTTNGSKLTNPELRARLLAHYDEVTVSVDALGATHDALRGFRGGFASVRGALQGLARARTLEDRPLKLRVNAVLMQPSARQFPDLCRELAGWGIDEITFNLLGGADRPDFHATHRLLPEQAATLSREIPALQRELAPRVLLRGGGPYLDRLRDKTLGRPLPVWDCHPGETFLFVNERGIVSPCSFTPDDYGIPISELVAVADLATLPERWRALRRTRRAPSCGDCPSTQVFAKWSMPELELGSVGSAAHGS